MKQWYQQSKVFFSLGITCTWHHKWGAGLNRVGFLRAFASTWYGSNDTSTSSSLINEGQMAVVCNHNNLHLTLLGWYKLEPIYAHFTPNVRRLATLAQNVDHPLLLGTLCLLYGSWIMFAAGKRADLYSCGTSKRLHQSSSSTSYLDSIEKPELLVLLEPISWEP